jgi:glycosyltransferase involved in cell wall biosynthesis
VRATTGLYGPERLILGLLAPLRAEGFEAEVAALWRAAGSPFAANPLAAAVRARGHAALALADGGPSPVAAAVAVARHLRRSGADLVHAHDYKANVVALLAAGWTGARAVATVHLHTRWSRRLRAYRALDRRLLRRFPAVLAVSRAIRDDLVAHGVPAARVAVAPGGVDPAALAAAASGDAPAAARARLGLGPADPVVTVPARLAPQKGQRDMLDALRRLLPRFPRLRLVLAGEGPDRAALEALAGRHGLGDAVRFAGFVEEPAGLLAASDVVALPSLDEGLPVALLEALALARPVVAAAVGGVPDLLRDGVEGRLVPPGRPDRLAEAIAWTLERPAEAAGAAARGRARVAGEFSAAAMAARTAAAYRGVAAAEARRAG